MKSTAIAYHERTKHHFHRLARSKGFMDWANQPDPFRRFEGAPQYSLPLSGAVGDAPSFADIHSAGAVSPAPPTVESLSTFLEHALGLSAWKAYRDTRWALRCNPSSGNLHPTEGYVICGSEFGIGEGAGVYHYAPAEHALELRCPFTQSMWTQLHGGRFAPGDFLMGLSSIHWREAWKYGERAYRYCQHDVGHAYAAATYAAAVLGWRVRWLRHLGDEQVALMLGLRHPSPPAREEMEHPDLIALVTPSGLPAEEPTFDSSTVVAVASDGWLGQPNHLSAEHEPWLAIREVDDACIKPPCDPMRWQADSCETQGGTRPGAGGKEVATTLIRQRRSAVAMDGRTSITLDSFAGMLARTLPNAEAPLPPCIDHETLINLAIFVHRVDGLETGLYALLRNAQHLPRLRAAMLDSFAWRHPDGMDADLPLYFLAPVEAAKCREIASTVSCGQDIAADGAFSLGMIADFAEPIERLGDWAYRRLFWEAGAVGQTLYLEAESAGVRATGIGCYFDDPVHRIFGLDGQAFQSLYHFTVGGPVEDTRLTTLPPYPETRRDRPSGWQPETPSAW